MASAVFPTDYSAASELDEDDSFPVHVDGTLRKAAGSLIRDFVGRGYTNVIDMVRDVGCDPTGVADNRDRIQEVIDEFSGVDGGAELSFPPNGRESGGGVSPGGLYKIDGPLDLWKTQDWDAKLWIHGVGRRGVELRQFDSTQPIFDMRNTTQNLRGVVISDLSLKYGAQQLYLSKAEYNLFRNVTFWQGGEGNTKSHVLESGSHFNYFDHCWWVHGFAGSDVGGLSSGTAFYTGCQFGEDVGNFYCGGEAWFDNCDFHYGEDAVLASGYQSMGKAQITVPTDGILNINNCRCYVQTNFINMDNASRVKITNSNITMGQGPVLKVRNTDSGYPLIFANNNVTWQGDGLFYASTLGEHLQNSVFMGNTFEVAPTFNATIDDNLLLSRYRNVFKDNTYRSGAIF